MLAMVHGFVIITLSYQHGTKGHKMNTQAPVVAIIPVYLVHNILKAGAGGFDNRLCKKFGYLRQQRMTGAVVSQGGITNTIVGNMHPDSYVGYSYVPRGEGFERFLGSFYVMPK